MAMVPVWSISFWERVETRASSAASFTTSTRTFPGGAWPRSFSRAARCASRASSEHRVLALGVEEDEVLALRPLVVPGDRQRLPGQAEVAAGTVLHARQLQRRDRVRVVPLAEGHPAGEEVERLVLLAPLAEAVQLGAGSDVVLLVQQLLERAHASAHVRGRRPGVSAQGQEEEARGGGSPHFTSS